MKKLRCKEGRGHLCRVTPQRRQDSHLNLSSLSTGSHRVRHDRSDLAAAAWLEEKVLKETMSVLFRVLGVGAAST